MALRFLFYGVYRDWKPLKGHDAPKGKVCVVRSLPGNVVTWASTPADALHKLKRALERAFEDRGSAVRWYEEQMRLMLANPEQGAMFDRLWSRVGREGREFVPEKMPTKFLHRDSYGALEPDQYQFVPFVNDPSTGRELELCGATNE